MDRWITIDLPQTIPYSMIASGAARWELTWLTMVWCPLPFDPWEAFPLLCSVSLAPRMGNMWCLDVYSNRVEPLFVPGITVILKCPQETERFTLFLLLCMKHVWMWELDCEESWVLKNWCFWTVVLEKTLESPLDCKEIQPVHSEGDLSCVFFGRNDAKAETPILWPPDAKSWLIWKDPDAGRDWGQEEKGMTEDGMAGWHHRLDGREFEWTLGVGDGQRGLVCCNSRSHKELDMTERLNWTEMKEIFVRVNYDNKYKNLEYISVALHNRLIRLTLSF